MPQYFGTVLFLCDADNKVLLPIITNLQQKYCNQPPFEPHITIYHATKAVNLAESVERISRATSQIKSFTVESEGFDYKDIWSKILYIKIKPNQILNSIRTGIEKGLSDIDSRPYTPHISLMYKDELSRAERNKIIMSLNIPKKYTVQGVQIVSPGESNENWRNYTKYEVVHSITFPKK